MDQDGPAQRIQTHRNFYARLITANAGLPPGSELEAALASTPRENFVGPPPWKVFTRSGYIDTNDRDPAILYQDVVVSLGVDGSLNNGQPTLHAYCITALAIKKGEHIVHVGAGSGYYTAILANLVGETGTIDAYEIHPELAARAQQNLAEFPHVTVHARSGAEPPLPSLRRPLRQRRRQRTPPRLARRAQSQRPAPLSIGARSKCRRNAARHPPAKRRLRRPLPLPGAIRSLRWSAKRSRIRQTRRSLSQRPMAQGQISPPQ